jgi:hypothetical protein
VAEGRQSQAAALASYAAFSAAHRWKFETMLRVQQLVPRVPPRVLAPAVRAMGTQRFVDWSFGHYLSIAPPSFALAGAPRPPLRARRGEAAAVAA